MPCRKEGGDVQAQSAPAVSVAVELPNSLSPIADKQITMGMRLPPLQGAREWLHGLNAPAHAEASAQRPTETSCADPRALPVRGCRKTVWVHPRGARKRGGIPEPAWAVINSAAAACGCPSGGGEATTVSVNVGAGRVCLDASERPPSGYPSDSQSWAAGSEPTVATPCYLNKAAQLCLCLFWMDSRARERDVMGRSGYQYYDYAVDRLRHRPGSPRRWPRRDSGRCRAVGGTTGHGSGGGVARPHARAECRGAMARSSGPGTGQLLRLRT